MVALIPTFRRPACPMVKHAARQRGDQGRPARLLCAGERRALRGGSVTVLAALPYFLQRNKLARCLYPAARKGSKAGREEEEVIFSLETGWTAEGLAELQKALNSGGKGSSRASASVSSGQVRMLFQHIYRVLPRCGGPSGPARSGALGKFGQRPPAVRLRYAGRGCRGHHCSLCKLVHGFHWQ